MLLKQLPQPPMGSMTRWDASEPLKVVFYAFHQKEPRRRKTGIRLLLLVCFPILLYSEPYFNFTLVN